MRVFNIRDRQTTVASKLLIALDPFFEFRGTMPARAIQAFLCVAEKPGLSVAEYAKRVGISPTTMSRFLLDLGERNRDGDEGHGLVDGKENILNRRERLYHLSLKGQALLIKIADRVRP